MPDDQRPIANAIDESCQPIAGSRKIYVTGSRPDIRVPMREIQQHPTPLADGKFEDNPPLSVYDTSGPYTDPDTQIDIRKGLNPIREAWIDEREDTEQLDGLSSEYGRKRANDVAKAGLRFEHTRIPRRARAGKNVSRSRIRVASRKLGHP